MLGNREWLESSVFDDDYNSEDSELSPLDDDFVRDEYRESEDI